ncbi:MAG TPA: lytic transglycosylase domain-containing protein [Spirochaetota bacterium]|nr:lytic transglycosylase domain-containing protein [Spirochaetota bacterium]HPI90654.1 lytic transglycosylase domain-containing protein [Spirochaetota bacterium]HPR49694.1 lytic transglycosylase domain-containing protein [Spirochaetota bacterium]
MIENVYSIMQRINEIRERFGLKGGRYAEQKATGGDDYQTIHDSALAEIKNGKPASEMTPDDINAIADRYARQYRVPASLVKAVIKNESNYNPEAVSPKGAMGLMQLMPSVASDFGIEDPFSPEENIKTGTALLGNLLREYNGDYKLALSAYNAGPGAVNEHNGVPDYPETRDYVKKVIESYLKNK